MNFYEYYTPSEELDNPSLAAALYLAEAGFMVLPCTGKEPTEQIRKSLKRINKLRTKPLHAHNIPFYFSEPHNIAILTGINLEVIDIDCKYDLKGSLFQNISRAIEFTLPEVWAKLVIQKSASGGYHLFYRCNQISGPMVLAERSSTADELQKGIRKLTLVETRGEGGYIMVTPSAGYEFVRGLPQDIQFITPEERLELLAICRSFNLFRAPEIQDFTSKQNGREDAPWNVFNRNNNYQWVQKELIDRGWEFVEDDPEKVYVLRPGSTAKSSGVIWKETGILFLFTPNTEFEANKGYTPFGVYCQLHFSGDFKACCRHLSEQGIGVFEGNEGEFFFINDKGKIKLKLRQIVNWLNDIGICKFQVSPTAYEIVQVVDNKAKVVDLSYVKRIFCAYIHQTCNDSIDNFFLKSFTGIFTKEGIINLVNIITPEQFIKPSQNSAYVFFQNAAILVSASDIHYLNYSNLPGYVWDINIIKRDIKPTDTSCEALQYMRKIAGDDEQRVNMLRSAIGFLLHPFKDPANPKCIILNDEYFDENENETEPQGGTGKGMFIKLVSHFRNVVTVDGKTFSFDKSFMYQRIGPETEIVAFEDVKKGFDFEKLFSVITEGWTIERKGKDEYTIPFERSPKILITSNYAIKGSSSSHRRRRYELEVSPHYRHNYTIKDEFGHLFFYDWDNDEWQHFDNMMIECLQYYLNMSFSEATYIHLDVKRLIEETSRDFYNWIDGLYKTDKMPDKISKSEMMDKFTIQYPDYHKKISQSKFTRWLKKYCDYKNIFLDSTNSYNGVMSYGFKKGFDSPTIDQKPTNLSTSFYEDEKPRDDEDEKWEPPAAGELW